MKIINFGTELRLQGNDDSDVKITISTNDQAITSVVSLNEKPIAFGNKIIGKIIGKLKELKDNNIIISSYVSDIRDDTNETNITYSIGTDQNTIDTTLNEKVDTDKDTMNYQAIFRVR